MREIFKRVQDSCEMIIETNLEALDVKEMNPWLFSVFLKQEKTADEKYEEFLETKESLIIALEHQDRAVFVGSRLYDGWAELYFYAMDSKRLDAITSKILTPSSYVYESNVVRDTKWNFYEKELYPTELEFCHIESDKIIFMLEEEGDDLSIKRDVEHYLSFETPSQKDRFLQNLDIEGVSFKDEISSDEFDNGIALIKVHAPTQKEISEVVDELYKKAKEFGGYYEGWSTTLARKE
ncbi:hypothetical protein M947_00990 [Sulfurimonas hongkongensis]|uniref:Uncharacterized protein n=1 Tax=Sulfurimonas hongkongensis TaxID=1172190 RepID=T0JH46_9BACT|nr:DUF695 domain-containing protein [Sulfurimonas hongkongensis]EQB40405.1 hypothetical protein M947_00990 [Sulfurimonas hongkongensis]